MSDRTQLLVAQEKMLLDAARHPPRNRRGNENNYAWVGKGQAGTAKKLQALGLGAYVSDGYSARFWIWDKGYELARDLEAEREMRRDEMKANHA